MYDIIASITNLFFNVVSQDEISVINAYLVNLGYAPFRT